MSEMRTERDSMGEVQVPAKAYYGAQTQRAVENFPVSGWALPAPLIHAMGIVKLACAKVNHQLGKLTGSGKNPLDDEQVESLLAACRAVADGKHDGEFPVDVFQTGSGTSSNMNINEVISNLAVEINGGDRFQPEKPIHPNDHVNMGQSTNDTFPTAIHVAVGTQIKQDLIPALQLLPSHIGAKGQRMGQDHQDRSYAFDGRNAVAAGTRDWADSPDRSNCRSDVPKMRSMKSSNCRWVAQPSDRASIRTPNSANVSARRLQKKRISPSSKRWTILKRTHSAMAWLDVMASYVRSRPRCLTWPTTSAG